MDGVRGITHSRMCTYGKILWSVWGWGGLLFYNGTPHFFFFFYHVLFPQKISWPVQSLSTVLKWYLFRNCRLLLGRNVLQYKLKEEENILPSEQFAINHDICWHLVQVYIVENILSLGSSPCRSNISVQCILQVICENPWNIVALLSTETSGKSWNESVFKDKARSEPKVY